MIDRTVIVIAAIFLLGSVVAPAHAQEKNATTENPSSVQAEKDDSRNAKATKDDRNQARENRRERRRDQRIERRKIRR